MQTKQMAECLRNLSPLLEQANAAVLLSIAEAIQVEGTKSFAPTAAKLEKRLEALGLASRKTGASELLDRMALLGCAAGAAPLSKDFTAAARLIELVGSLDASQIPNTLTVALAPPPKKSKSAQPTSVDAREAADRLTTESENTARFDALLKEFGKLSKDNLAEIARYYLGYSRPYKSKPEIVKAIRARQLQDALDANRGERVSKISV